MLQGDCQSDSLKNPYIRYDDSSIQDTNRQMSAQKCQKYEEMHDLNTLSFYKQEELKLFPYLSLQIMNDQEIQQFLCQIGVMKQEQRNSPSMSKQPEKLSIESNKKLPIQREQKEDSFSSLVERGPHYIYSQEPKASQYIRQLEKLSIESNRKLPIQREEKDSSSSSSVGKGVHYIYSQEPKASQSIVNDFYSAKKSFERQVRDQAPPQFRKFLEKSLQRFDKLFLDQSRLIKEMVTVRSRRDAQMTILYSIGFPPNKIKALEISYRRLMQSFYKQNDYHNEYQGQAMMQQHERKIKQLKNKIKEINQQNSRLYQDVMKYAELRSQEEARSSQRSRIKQLEEKIEKMKEQKLRLLQRIDNLKNMERINHEKIKRLQQSHQQTVAGLEAAFHPK